MLNSHMPPLRPLRPLLLLLILVFLAPVLATRTCSSGLDCGNDFRCFNSTCRLSTAADLCDPARPSFPPGQHCKRVPGGPPFGNGSGDICVTTRGPGQTCKPEECSTGYSCSGSDEALNPICVVPPISVGRACDPDTALSSRLTTSICFCSQCLPRSPGSSFFSCQRDLPRGAACDSAQPSDACELGSACRGDVCAEAVEPGELCDEQVGPYCRPSNAAERGICAEVSVGEKRCFVTAWSVGQSCGRSMFGPTWAMCPAGQECFAGRCGFVDGGEGSLCGSIAGSERGCEDGLVCDNGRCSLALEIGDPCVISGFSFCREGTCDSSGQPRTEACVEETGKSLPCSVPYKIGQICEGEKGRAFIVSCGCEEGSSCSGPPGIKGFGKTCKKIEEGGNEEGGESEDC